MIPDDEVDILTRRVTEVLELVEGEQFEQAFAALMDGLRRARAIREEAPQWGEELVQRWEAVIENYCDSYGPPLG